METESIARQGLIDLLVEQGSIRSDRVRGAFERVRRSVFIPDAPLDQVYADRTHVVAQDDGVKVSTVSAPSVQALMLERLDLQAGEDVLEIGSGGTNAALLAEMVAPGGSVWTVDIDQRVIDRARAALDAHPTPVPVRADRIDAWADGTAIAAACFDAIEFTVDTWTFPSWLPDALRPGGRVSAPMGVFGMGVGWTFTFEDGRLIGRDPMPGGFVAARGAGEAGPAPVAAQSGDVVLAQDDDVSSEWLERMLADEGEPIETGVRLLPGSLYVPVFLWVLAASERAGTIRSASGSRERGFPGANWMATPVWLAEEGMAVVDREIRDGAVDLVVRGFGRDGADLAGRMAERLRAWPGDAEGARLEAVFVGAEQTVDPAAPATPSRILRRGDWIFRLFWE